MQRTYRIHPAIGVARVGNSPDDYYVGPEAPGVLPTLNQPDSPSATDGKHRDAQGRVKRQGARFRVYEYTHDDAGAVTQVREITAADAQIEWQVHLANRKAAAIQFNGSTRRNEGLPEDQLIIDTGSQKISGIAQKPQRLQGSFMQVPVVLGDLITDRAGRLIVLGGFGHSQSVPPGRPLENYSNNDGWCDDVSDGPVRATVRLKDSRESVAAEPSWVMVTPPDYAPGIQNVITLYDIVYSMMAKIDPALAVNERTRISFSRDIFPILRRASSMHWVSDISSRGHSPSRRGHFLSRMDQLSSNKPAEASARDQIFQKLRNPLTGGGGNMPKLPASIDKDVALTVALTEVQYARMGKWARGEFDADWTGQAPEPLPLDRLPVREQPTALDRAALEACVGAGRFPGIEAGRVMLEPDTYDPKRLFRIDDRLVPGTLTARMAIPWQADFRDCEYEEEIGLDWWPGQRPNEVWRLDGTELKRERWVPQTDEWTADDTRRPTMVAKWSGLGFVVKKKIDGEDKFVEDERTLE